MDPDQVDGRLTGLLRSLDSRGGAVVMDPDHQVATGRLTGLLRSLDSREGAVVMDPDHQVVTAGSRRCSGRSTAEEARW